MIHSGGERTQVITNQAHIVCQWHPTQAQIVGRPADALDDGTDVCGQVVMR